MTQRIDPINVRWGDVRAKVRAELDDLKDALVTATPDKIAGLQGRAIALQSLISWFEHGAPADAAISGQTTDKRTPLGGY